MNCVDQCIWIQSLMRTRISSSLLEKFITDPNGFNQGHPPNTHWSITRPLACPWNWEISLGGKNDVKYIGKWWKKWSKICLNQKRRRKSSEIPPLWREFSNVRGTVVLSLWGRWIFFRLKTNKLQKHALFTYFSFFEISESIPIK